MSVVAASRAVCVRADGASARATSSASRASARANPGFAAVRPSRRRFGDVDFGRARRARDLVVRRVAERKAAAGEIDDEEARYREMMKITKDWMAYDPDEVPESHPAPWETHVQNLMENGPWPCWNADLPEEQQEPEFVPFNEAPRVYSAFDDKAKMFKKQVTEERAAATALRQAEIRSRSWMSMDHDVRLADIPSCDERGWSHEKILELISYPEEVAAAMESYSVHIYDPRFPIDNTWIPPPEPDTWEFIRKIGHAGVEGEDEQDVGDRLAIKNGIAQRFDTEADGNEFLNQTSEAKLARAIDIGEEDDDDDDDERADKRRRNDDDDDDDDDE
jgi:hypothetical protein